MASWLVSQFGRQAAAAILATAQAGAVFLSQLQPEIEVISLHPELIAYVDELIKQAGAPGDCQ